MVLVTGGTGHLGNVLVKKLLESGERVRVLLLPDEPVESLEGLPVQAVIGDVRNEASLVAAFQGCEYVYHLAGIVSILKEQSQILEEVNVKGTRNVVNACLKAGVRRLVYTSSVHAFAEIPAGVLIDERAPISPREALGEYGKSKAQATIEVLKGTKRGLDAVVVCPAGVIGPYDYRASRMGRFILYLMQSSFLGLPDGAYNFVDVRDIAEGEMLACRNGKSGEVYILSGERITFKDLLRVTRNLVGRTPSYVRLPMWLCRAGALFGEFSYRLTHKEPLLTQESLDTIVSNCALSSAKAEREIGYRHRPIAETIRDTVAWLTRNRKLSFGTPR